jgi:hypothetical protein
VSGEDGRWTLPDLRRDLVYEVEVNAADRAGAKFVLPSPPEGVDLVDAGVVVLSAGARVEGVVLDAAGKPASGVEVSVSGAGQARVDDLGRFRIAGVPAGEREILVVRPDAYVLLETKVTVPPEGELRDLVLRIPAFRKLVVRVTDPAGKPLAGVEVYAFWEEDCDWTTTDAGGRAVLDQIKAEVVDLSTELNAPGNVPLRPGTYVTGVRPEGQEVVVVMEEGTTLSGVVLGADGKPAAKARVSASCEAREDAGQWDEADEAGRFLLRVHEGLAFDLTAQREDGSRKVIESATLRQVSGPKEDLEIRLEPIAE